MYQLIKVAQEEIANMQKHIEDNDREIFDRVNANNSMRSKIQRLQYEIDKIQNQNGCSNVPAPPPNAGMMASVDMCKTNSDKYSY